MSEALDQSAPEERDLNHDLSLQFDDERATSMSFPVLVHDKLDSLVASSRKEGLKTSKKETMAALIAFTELDGEQVAKLVMHYRKTTRGEYLEQNPDLRD